jgi:regulator of nucleoside diphosphate kinase
MIGRKAAPKGAVVITNSDRDRLKHLLESPRHRSARAVPLAPLRQELYASTVVAPTCVPRCVVTMRSRVRVRDLNGGGPETVSLVYPDEADLDAGRISVLAPMGAALLGARVGTIVAFNTPGGRRRLKVTRMLYQPEAAGDFHL